MEGSHQGGHPQIGLGGLLRKQKLKEQQHLEIPRQAAAAFNAWC